MGHLRVKPLPLALSLDFGKYESNVCDAPESSSFNQEEQPIRIAC